MFTNPLDNIRVASPCPADWDQMFGDERTRFCSQCKLNVYNLSGMTRREAENLLIDSEGRLCVRYFKRRDGTVLTRDCPVGWAAMKRRVSRVATAFASVVIGFVSGILSVRSTEAGISLLPLGGVTQGEIVEQGAMVVPMELKPVEYAPFMGYDIVGQIDLGEEFTQGEAINPFDVGRVVKTEQFKKKRFSHRLNRQTP